MKLKRWLSIGTLVTVSALIGCSSEEATNTGVSEEGIEYPTQDVRIVVPYNPGGSSDSTARTIAEIIKSEELLDENVNVVNLPGANTRQGLEEVLNAEPDGHTLLLHHSTLNAMNAVGQLDIGYEDYELIAQVSYTPNVLVGHADSEYQTLDEYVAAAKKDPGSISVGIPNIGSTAHLSYETLMQALGAEGVFKVVPYQSGSDLITAHLGGQVDLRIASTPDSIEYVESGDVIPLATTGYEKHYHPALADAVSFSDIGLDTGVVVRFGFYAPKDTPSEVVDKLEEVFKQVVETEEFQSFADTNGAKAEFLSTEEFLAVNEEVQGIFDGLADNIDLNE